MEEFKKNRPPMTDEEALKACEEMIASCKRGPVEEWRPGFLDAAASALREKVAAKKPKRPTMEEMEEEVRCRVNKDRSQAANDRLMAAADLIKAVLERVVPWLRASVAGCKPEGTWLRIPDIHGDSCSRVYAADLLRALGEEP